MSTITNIQGNEVQGSNFELAADIFVVAPNIKGSDSNNLRVTSMKSKHGIKKRRESGAELIILLQIGIALSLRKKEKELTE